MLSYFINVRRSSQCVVKTCLWCLIGGLEPLDSSGRRLRGEDNFAKLGKKGLM